MTVKPFEFDLQYEEARREARKLLGESAEVVKGEVGVPFSFQVGVRTKDLRFALVGAGNSFRAALDDAKQRMALRPKTTK
jgi:hypothetical protein